MPIPTWLKNGEDKYGDLTYDQIDCSHLVSSILKDAGSTVPHLATWQINGKDGVKGDLSSVGEIYFKKVSGSDVKPGDIVLFNGHMGIVESYDSTTGRGTFFGSQSSTGPDSVDFGPGTGFWDKPYKILEIKPQYYPKSSSLTDDQQQLASDLTEQIIPLSSTMVADSTDSTAVAQAAQNAADRMALNNTLQNILYPFLNLQKIFYSTAIVAAEFSVNRY